MIKTKRERKREREREQGMIAKRKVIYGIFLFLVVLLLALPFVHSLGIRPAKTEIAIEETRDFVGEVWVVNTDQVEFTAQLAVEGEMAQYVTLGLQELRFRGDEEAKAVPFEVHLPAIVPPGQSTANILVEETVSSGGGGGGGGGGKNDGTASAGESGGGNGQSVSSKILLKHKIIIQGPYPDKYVVAKLNFHDQGQEIAFVSEVQNLGKQPLGEVQTTFYVNDQKQQEQVVETETTSLALKETKLLTKKLPRDLFTLGEFEVSAVTYFDGQQVELIKKLVVGEPTIDITYFDQYFIAYAVNQYSLDLLNRWNQKLNNVFVEVSVKKEEKEIDTFRTRSLDLEGEMLKRIQDYLDAKDKGPGIYTFDMVVNYWHLVRNQQKPFRFESEFLPPEDAEKAKALAGKASTAEESEKNNGGKFGETFTGIALWLLVGLLLGGGGGYILWRYVHREQYEGEKEGEKEGL